MVKTWQCILLAIVVHGLIFSLPLSPSASREPEPETVQLVITDPPPILQECPEPEVQEPPQPVKPPKPLPIPQKPKPAVCKPQKKPLAQARPEPVSVQAPEPSTDSLPQAESTPLPEQEPASGPPSSTSATSPAGSKKAASPASEGPVESKVGAVGGPQFVHRALPQYPRIARRMGMEGTVTLRLTIDASGKLTGVEVVQSAGHGFDEEALRAVRQSTFAPAVREGRPIPCVALLQIRFQLNTGE